MSKPIVKARLSEHFNQRVQTDLFFLWERTYIILIDECIRYAVVAHLENKTATCWYEATFEHWIRLFGPMGCLASDQEGAVISDLIGIACEKFNIDRDLGGSYGHSAAQVAERRLAIIKLGALKLWETSRRTGLQVTQDQCVQETCMATNLMLSYAGASPAQALTGVQPRELYDPENKSVSASSGAIESVPDAIETAIRLRLHAKDCILQAVVEDRLAKANNTRNQIFKPEDIAKLVDGAKIDLWREPDEKCETGWRGPAELVRLYRGEGKAIVNWRGHAMMVPLRHVKPHVGFVWFFDKETYTNNSSEIATVVSDLMQLVDNTPIG